MSGLISCSSVGFLDTDDGHLDLPLTAKQKLQPSTHLENHVDTGIIYTRTRKAQRAAIEEVHWKRFRVFDGITNTELQNFYLEREADEVSRMGLWVGLIERAFALIDDTEKKLWAEEGASLLSRTMEEMVRIVERIQEKAMKGGG